MPGTSGRRRPLSDSWSTSESAFGQTCSDPKLLGCQVSPKANQDVRFLVCTPSRLVMSLSSLTGTGKLASEVALPFVG